MKIYLGADHRGFSLKEQIKSWLIEVGREVVDCGNTAYDETDDYPDFAFAVADKVVADTDSLGILICGSGGGMTIAANKVKGIRAAESSDVNDAIHNRSHNNCNILVLSADTINFSQSKMIAESFIETAYESDDRFVRRLAKIAARENV